MSNQKQTCLICSKELKNLSRHIKEHRISTKDYYDKFLKTENEDICLVDSCHNKTSFKNMYSGYNKFCKDHRTFGGNIVKLQKYGFNFCNPVKNIKTLEEKYGDRNYVVKKMRKVSLDKYHCNISKLQCVKDKKKIKYYSKSSDEKKIYDKQKKTNIENGLWSNTNKDDFYKYTKTVNRFTYHSKKLLVKTKNIANFQVDHQFSIKQGFLDNICPWVIGHIRNLRLISQKDNISKGSKCCISNRQLFNRVIEYEN